MDKQDILYLVAGIVIVLVLAFIVKPAVTGEEASLNLWDFGDGDEEEMYEEIVSATLEPIPTTFPPSTPLPTPTWSGSVQSLSFVDPAIYDVEFATPTLGIEPPSDLPHQTTWSDFATISGEFSGTTDVFYIPFDRWRISYTVEPMNPEHSVFSVDIRDAMDPNREVGEISVKTYEFVPVPEVDESGELTSVSDGTSSGSGIETTFDENEPSKDWGSHVSAQNVIPPMETAEGELVIREGSREYYLIITANVIESYSIKIQVASD